ncbi:hypothetical protein BJ165DRAFT_1527960 [Panaeolus papilionaceus]|nr:hypothetical protein BJ165DRAFT_1527960 [Panaeolus papilionaceus]
MDQHPFIVALTVPPLPLIAAALPLHAAPRLRFELRVTRSSNKVNIVASLTSDLALIDHRLCPLVCVRIPLDNGHRDIYVPTNIMRGIFVGMLCAEMNVHPVTAEFGWKTTEDNEGLPPRALQTQAQLQDAINVVLGLQRRDQQSNALVIVHLNYHGLAYRSQMLLLDKRLRCANHPHRWCYIRPGTDTPEDHQGLGVHELHMWGKRMHDGLADPTGTVPPDCFIWSNPYPTQVVYGGIIGQVSTYDSNNKTEALLLETVLDALDAKYPCSKFSQYQDRLYERGIFYAVNALHFGHQYYMSLGMSEGAIGTFLEELKRATRKDSELEDEIAAIERELSVAAFPDSEMSMEL